MLEDVIWALNPESRFLALPAQMLLYNQAQSSQHPKRGTSSNNAVLQSSTTQPASEARHLQYYCCTTTKHNPATIRNERGTSSTNAVLPYSTIQPGPQSGTTQSSLHPKRGTSRHNPAASTRHFQYPVRMFYNQVQSIQLPKRGTSNTNVVLQSSTIQRQAGTRHFQY